MIILVLGNPINGFEFVGPFEDHENAIQYAEAIYSSSTWWVVEVSPLPK